jgi:hypothetical protein
MYIINSLSHYNSFSFMSCHLQSSQSPILNNFILSMLHIEKAQKILDEIRLLAIQILVISSTAC